MQPSRVGVVILAAGGSRRMGHPKQLLPFDGRTLLRRAVDTALATTCRPVVVTTGAYEDLIRAELQSLPVSVAHNPDWMQGLSSSLRIGIEALVRAADGDLEGVVITLADQPLVGVDDINRLVEVHRLTGKEIVASEYAGTQGVPMFMAARLFGEAIALTGNVGAKSLISRHVEQVASVPLPAAAMDVDTRADYERLSRL
jgi:molybdenum cofactor cytidylyltransferase